jgi:serine/threonine protein kinase
MGSVSSIPSECLKGLTLDGDWIVGEIIHRNPHSTGGNFSTGYQVERSKQKAFLKAIDFSRAFQAQDMSRALQDLTSEFNFERDLLQKCRDRNMDKIVTPICSGEVKVSGFGLGLERVPYIIFELADRDIRCEKISNSLSISFILRSLHHICVGLKQLHSSGIAHQDLKPSNVLIFNGSGKINSKIGDLGSCIR